MIFQCKFEPSRKMRPDENENCKTTSLEDTVPSEDTHLVIKTTAFMGPMFRVIKELYPHFTLIYNTRNLMETMQSLGKVTDVAPKSRKNIFKSFLFRNKCLIFLQSWLKSWSSWD